MAATRKVKVLRAFYWQGKPVKPGEVVEVPDIFAAELVSVRKAENVAAPAKAPTPSTSDEPVEPAKAGKHAR